MNFQKYWIIINQSRQVLCYASLMQENTCCSFTFPISVPGLIMQISYGSALMTQNLTKILTTRKRAIQIIFNLKKKNHARSIFHELNVHKICQINLLSVLIFM